MADLFDNDQEVNRKQIFRSARQEFEIQSKVGAGGATFGAVLAVALLAGTFLAFALVVRSLWLFTHPDFNFTVPKLPSLTAISLGESGEAPKADPDASSSPLPSELPQIPGATDDEVTAFLKNIKAQGDPIASALTDRELGEIGAAMCDGVGNGFADGQIIDGFKTAMITKFPEVDGIETFGDKVLRAAKETLCAVAPA